MILRDCAHRKDVMQMRVDKGKIVEMFRVRGDDTHAEQCDSRLPDVVDTAADVELLNEQGIDPRVMGNRLPPDAPGPPERS